MTRDQGRCQHVPFLTVRKGYNESLVTHKRIFKRRGDLGASQAELKENK